MARQSSRMEGAGPGRPFLKAFGLTLMVLVAVRLLHQVPIPGLSPSGIEAGAGETARTSIAAVALQPWISALAFVQLAILALPARWTGRLSQGGVAHPFGLVALVLAGAFAFGQASGIATVLRTIGRLPGSEGFAMAALVVGAALVIGCAWLIQRFGLGHGFWIVFAASVIADLVTGLPQTVELVRMIGSIQPMLGWIWVLGSAALTAGVTLLVLRGGGRFEHVAWPLILASVATTAAMPVLVEVVDLARPEGGIASRGALTVLTVLFTAAFTFMMLRRVQLLSLVAPVSGALAVIVAAEAWGLSQSLWLSPASALSVVAAAALLTALAWQTRLGWHTPPGSDA